MKTVKAFIKSHPVLSYFALTFAISWGLALIIIVVGPGGILATPEQFEMLVPFVALATLAGPLVAGIVLTGILYGRVGFRDLFSKMRRWRVGARWYAVAHYELDKTYKSRLPRAIDILKGPTTTWSIIAVQTVVASAIVVYLALSESRSSSCCGSSAGERGLDSEALGVDWTGGGYSSEELGGLPEAAGAASLGCGNPTALATLSPGEVVLDLGSGGIDVLLSAKRVSPGGRAYGLDMTDEVLELAEKNRAEAGAENVEFLKGHIEEIPLPEDHVDVVISNCVINLSTDKPKVVSEAFRVLKPGGASRSPTWSSWRTRASFRLSW